MSAVTLVLLPGLLCDDAVWVEQCAALSGQAQCVVPEYGMLDSISAMAAHVLATVDAPRFALAGHSMGGRIALEMVRQAPERIERLALMDTGYHPWAAGEAGDKERTGRMALLDIAQREGMRAMGRQWAPGMVHPDRIGTPVFDEILDMICRSTPERFAAQINALLNRPDAAPLLPRIACPTLLLCGRQDQWSPLARHEDMQKLIPQARLAVIEDSGHMSTMEQPAVVSAALKTWLEEPARG